LFAPLRRGGKNEGGRKGGEAEGESWGNLLMFENIIIEWVLNLRDPWGGGKGIEAKLK